MNIKYIDEHNVEGNIKHQNSLTSTQKHAWSNLRKQHVKLVLKEMAEPN